MLQQINSTLKKKPTAVRDDAFWRVPLSVAGDGGQPDQVGLWFDQFSQVVGQQLALLDAALHRDLLLPPPSLTRLRQAEHRWFNRTLRNLQNQQNQTKPTEPTES